MSSEEEAPSIETLTGCAEGEFYALTMYAGGTKHTERSPAPLSLRLTSGGLVSLELSAARIAQNVDESGEFGALLERGIASPFLHAAPGDHVKVRIRGIRIDDGASIAARGRVAHTRAEEGYREAGELEPSSMNVELVATRESPEAAERALAKADRAPVQEEKERPAVRPAPTPVGARVALWPIAVPGVPALVLAVASVLTLVLGDRSSTAAAASTGVIAAYFAILTIFFAARRRFAPDLRSPSEDCAGVGFRTYLPLGAVIVWALLFVVGGVALVAIATPGGEAFPLGVLATTGLVFFAWATAAQRRALSRLWLVARTPIARSPGRTGALDGRVANGSAKRTRKHTVDQDTYTTSEGQTTRSTRVSYADEIAITPLTVELENGGSLNVTLHGGAFAAEEPIEDGLSLTETIEAGDRVRVVGRPSGDEGAWQVSYTGPGSLFVLGSKRRSARAAAVRALVLHVCALLALAGLSAAAIALALLV